MVQLEEQSLLAPEDLCLNYANFIYRKLYRKYVNKEKDWDRFTIFKCSSFLPLSIYECLQQQSNLQSDVMKALT